MPYTISVSEDGDYIIVEMIGEMTRGIANRHVIEGHALGAKLGIRCHLIDVTKSRNVQSAIDNFKFTREDIRRLPGADRRACVAVLADSDDHSHDFYISLAQTAGLDVTLFRDRYQAVAHLKAAAVRFRAGDNKETG